jgi:hypothetical protein
MTYKTNIPINYGLLHSGLPLIVVEIKNQNLCFLLDTGSNKNLIDKRVSEFFRNEFVSVGEGKTIGIEGNHQENKIIKLDFKISNNQHTGRFYVSELNNTFAIIEQESDIQIHGILGNEFLIENEWILDFKNLNIILSH